MDHSAPLNALRAFEAAARTGSFTNAARELNVSPAAVSQQVKLLETYWDTTLFIRQGNRLALTDSGLTAYPQLGRALGALRALSGQMRRVERSKRLVLSAPQSVAETWLPAKLSALSEAELNALDIRVEEDPVDFARDQIDLRVFYGHNLYTDYRVDPLFTDHLIAVASPDFVAQAGADLAAIEECDLIHTDWGPGFASSPNWARAMPDGRLVNHQRGLRVSASSTALCFARLGRGVALVPAQMAAMDLAVGRLQQLATPELKMPRPYEVAYPNRLADTPKLRAVVRLLAGG